MTAGLAGRRLVPPALPDFPWDSLEPYGQRARAHPGGLVDLSVGTPVDPTPAAVQAALAAAGDSPGYPAAAGTPGLRAAIAGYLSRRFGVRDLGPAGVLPTIGSKELVALLPSLLGVRGAVAFPALAYPTYDVGARFAGLAALPYEGVDELDGAVVGLLWLNSPANPTGRVLDVDELRALVGWARAHDVVVASDECYAELGWDAECVSVLDPRVCDGRHDGLLALHSLSKRSNMAGHRAAFVAGDPTLVAAVLAVRRHLGLLPPGPVQAAMIVALDDDAHVAEQRARYATRRTALRAALAAAGFTVTHSAGGLYLWATRGEDCWDTVGWLADRGILVAPGSFYGAGGGRHVRVALTATDERVTAAVARLTG